MPRAQAPSSAGGMVLDDRVDGAWFGMRVALIADVHGNLVALETALADIERRAPDVIVCLGDVAASGPRPAECIHRIEAVDALIVQGNSDAWLAAPPELAGPSAPYEEVREIDAWCRTRLGAAEVDLMNGYSFQMHVPLGERCGLFACHGSPRSFDEPMRSTTTQEDLGSMLSGIDAAVVAAAHTHQPMIRRHEGILLVNPGSVGMPLEYRVDGTVRNPPWAEYGIVSHVAGRMEVSLHRCPLDVAAIADDVRASGMPRAEFWLEGWLTP